MFCYCKETDINPDKTKIELKVKIELREEIKKKRVKPDGNKLNTNMLLATTKLYKVISNPFNSFQNIWDFRNS